MEKDGGDDEGRVKGCFFCSHFAGVSHLTRSFERATAERWLRLSLTSEPFSGSLSPQHFPVAFALWQQRWKSGDSAFPWLCQERRQRRQRVPWPRGPLQVPRGRGAPRKHSGNLWLGTLGYRGYRCYRGRGHNFLSPLSRLNCPQNSGVGWRQGAKPPFPTRAPSVCPCRPAGEVVSAAIDRHSRQVVTLKLERSV